MNRETALAMLLLLGATPTLATDETARIHGTICRTNRHADRLIVMTDDGMRLKVVLRDDAAVTVESAAIEREDVRPGVPVTVTGILSSDRLEAWAADVQIRVADVLWDVLVGPPRTLTGRFGVREAQTEFFQFRLEGGNYIRVDAKAAYGPKGRAWVKNFRSGDLLELGGSWTKPGEFRASYIKNITDEEPISCSSRARKNESEQETATREAAERRFLDGYDDDLPEQEEEEVEKEN